MIVGVDFDNTIVCYDKAFHRAACERGLIPPDIPATKEQVRNYLRSIGKEDEWTELQGYVYGARMDTVEAFAGVISCLRFLKDQEIEIYIISHKTLYPFRGTCYNLHEAALNWMDTSGFLDEAGLDIRHVFFELTKEEKLARIADMRCSHFIDDLPEILCAKGFPASTIRMLFSPGFHEGNEGMLTFASWEEISAFFEGLIPEKSAMTLPGIRSRAAKILAGTGCLANGEIIPLGSGGNNRVYRVEAGPSTFLLKEYFRHPGDNRDRLGVEFAFTQFAWARGLRCVPEPIACDSESGLGLFSFIEGERISPGELSIAVGEVDSFTATVTDSEGEEVETEITWIVTDEIGSINVDGEFTAEAEGSGYVIAQVGELADSASVTVTEESQPEAVIVSVEIHPSSHSLSVGNTIKFRVEALDENEEEVEDVDVTWEALDEEIGTISNSGLFTAESVGETQIIVTVSDISDTAAVTVTEASAGGDGNTANIYRVSRNGKTNQIGNVYEGSAINIGGLPHPLNYLNGGKLTFPENSLIEDISITIKLPDFAQIQETDVEFEGNIVIGVTFEVKIGDEVQATYTFNEPLTLVLPFKRGLLNNLGINPMDLGMYYVNEDGDLVSDGITNVVVDSTINKITANIAHFSDVVVAPEYSPLAIDDNDRILPGEFTLSQNIPNPFNPSTTIEFAVPSGNTSNIVLEVYDLRGGLVRKLVNGIFEGGSYSTVWDGHDQFGRLVSSGVYFYRLEAKGFIGTRKMLLIR